MTPAEQLAADFRRLGVASGEVRINQLRTAIHRGSIQIARSWYGFQDLAEFAPMESDLATLLASAYRILDPRNRPNYQERIFLACLSERPHPTERRIRCGLTETRPTLWSAMARMASKQDELQPAEVDLSPGESASWRLVGIDPDPEADELSQANAASLYGMLADRPEQARDGKSDKRTLAGNSDGKGTKRGAVQSHLPKPMDSIGTVAPRVTSQTGPQKSRSKTNSILEERREVVKSLLQLSKGKPARKSSAVAKATSRGITPAAANPSDMAKKQPDPVPSATAPSSIARTNRVAPSGPQAAADSVKSHGAMRHPTSDTPQPQRPGRLSVSKGRGAAAALPRAQTKAAVKAKKKLLSVAAIQTTPNQSSSIPHGQKVTWTQLLWQWLRWPLSRSRSSRDSNVSKWIDGLSSPHRDSSKSV